MGDIRRVVVGKLVTQLNEQVGPLIRFGTPLIEEEGPATISAWHRLFQHTEESSDRPETRVFLLPSTVVDMVETMRRKARIGRNETI